MLAQLFFFHLYSKFHAFIYVVREIFALEDAVSFNFALGASHVNGTSNPTGPRARPLVSVGPDSTSAVQWQVDLAPVAESGAESSDEEEDEAQVASAAHGQQNHPPSDPRMPD